MSKNSSELQESALVLVRAQWEKVEMASSVLSWIRRTKEKQPRNNRKKIRDRLVDIYDLTIFLILPQS
ncbi:hypothetical protein KQX54_017928 [Cotesia glomerata]|uniref:Uncharacterized protein n=1 Tax=Cotesia glomerata TaxID=32391 RepID=A0AAV7ICV9_COTGL|nr:hypothetical protein KQX54_017928 [Cotesia glomerata]